MLDKYDKDRFSEDFQTVISRVRELSACYDLPNPTIVFHPVWRAAIRQMDQVPFNIHRDVLRLSGIRLEFGDIIPDNLIIRRY